MKWSPQAVKTGVFTTGVVVTTVVGTLWGAELKSKQEVKQVCTKPTSFFSLREPLSLVDFMPLSKKDWQ
jgi:hypothetical protein